MARYIDADKLCEGLKGMASVQEPYKQNTILGVVSTIENFPTADVAPRAEVAREIFWEIENKQITIVDHMGTMGVVVLLKDIFELKKKYTEPEPPKGD